ncbi:MAG: hypothetical protein CMM74_15680 [Rhodospirillaceae bacterium]|jgi:hypothetical protein|nr:hypothetical protein [Rhodospirillaceae bacterium]
MIEKQIRLELSGKLTSEILYAAAFIHPAVRDVSVEGSQWRFQLDGEVDAGLLERGLKKLSERFEIASDFAIDPVFTLEFPEGGAKNGGREDLENGIAVQEIHPGLNVYRDPVSSLVRFLDQAILDRFAAPFGAVEETYPNCIPVSALGLAEHFSSFPEHLHYLVHLIQDLDELDAFAAKAKEEKDRVALDGAAFGQAELVHNPSTCYHCYASRRGGQVDANTAITAITKCHRFEAANHKEFGRLLEFSMREIVFLGHPDYIRDRRIESLRLIQELAEDWRMFGELVQSNDPFFTTDFSAKAVHQQRMAMKFEYRMTIPGQEKKLSVLSSNLHGVTFAKAFSMKRPKGPLHTGCLAFGIERMALSIIAQHGVDLNAWPENLAAEYHSWKSCRGGKNR